MSVHTVANLGAERPRAGRQAQESRVRRWRPTRTDVIIAAAAGTAIAVDAATAAHTRGPVLVNLILCVLVAVPLAWRRRTPLVAAAASLALGAIQTALLTPLTVLTAPMLLLILPPYAVAAYSDRRRTALGGLLVCALGVAVVTLVTPEGPRAAGDLTSDAIIVAIAWIAGRAVHDRMQRARRLADLDARLRATRHSRERLAVAEQRAHVARELHDVIAHSMTVICLQAGAAQRVWSIDRAAAQAATATVRAVANDTLAQLHDALALLETEDSANQLQQYADLEALAHRARAPGLDVAVQIDGEPDVLPTAIALAAYRVVQEALTNAARYAAPTDVVVRLSYESDALEVEIRDSGCHRGALSMSAVSGSGNGLRGMRERVEACAGVLSYGPLPAGGFAVSARLPLVSAA